MNESNNVFKNLNPEGFTISEKLDDKEWIIEFARSMANLNESRNLQRSDAYIKSLEPKDNKEIVAWAFYLVKDACINQLTEDFGAVRANTLTTAYLAFLCTIKGINAEGICLDDSVITKDQKKELEPFWCIEDYYLILSNHLDTLSNEEMEDFTSLEVIKTEHWQNTFKLRLYTIVFTMSQFSASEPNDLAKYWCKYFVVPFFQSIAGYEEKALDTLDMIIDTLYKKK